VRTIIYVDGFNFYYGAVKDTPYRWLDFKQLLLAILKKGHHEIKAIRYFTALVSATSEDPDKPTRQETYIRALEAYLPEISVHYGFFLRSTLRMPLVHPTSARRFESVLKMEEKGSDVNLALHLYRDACQDLYDCAVVVSNDSDLSEGLRLVKQDFNKLVGLITPTKKHPARELMKYADFVRRVRTGALASSQLPNPIPGTNLRKPATW